MHSFFFPGFRDTSSLTNDLQSGIRTPITPVILPGYKGYTGKNKEFSLDAIGREGQEKIGDDRCILFAHSLSSRVLMESLLYNNQVKFILLNPAFSPEDAVKNMFNFYNRRNQTTVGDILENPDLYPGLIGDEVIGDSKQFQRDLNDSVKYKDQFKRTLDTLRGRCLVLVNPNDKIIEGNRVIEEFGDHIDIQLFSSPQGTGIVKSHIPKLGRDDFDRINDFVNSSNT